MKLALVLVLILVVNCVNPAKVVNPAKAQQAIRLSLCKFLGFDGGVNQALRRVLVSRDDPLFTRQCLLGCEISWALGSNYALEFETGLNPIAKLGGPIYRRLFFFTQQCVKVSILGQQKCSMFRTLPTCVFSSYKNYVIQKFVPWWPALKSIVNTLINIVPPLRRARDAANRAVAIAIDKTLNGVFLKPLIKWLLKQLRSGFLNNFIKNLITAAIIALGRIAIPPPLPNPIPVIIVAMKLLFGI